MEPHLSSKQQLSSTRKELFRLERELSSAEKQHGLTPRGGDGAVGLGGEVKQVRGVAANKTKWSEEERQRMARLLVSSLLLL